MCGGASDSEGRRRRRKVSSSEAEALPGTREVLLEEAPRHVNNQVLVELQQSREPFK